ncbi:MAG: beta strand repeat-containing protein, partial [Gemmataceae bacterium]
MRPAGIFGLIARLFPDRGKKAKASPVSPRLLELESRIVPASAIFTNTSNVPLLTITLGANEAFDYQNEFKDTANNNALTGTAGFFKLSAWNSTTNSFQPAKWAKLTDTTKTWVNNQVGSGTALDSIQLAPGKSLAGINIKVTGGTGWDGAYFRANPDKADGIFTGTVTVDVSVDDTVCQDYAFVSRNDINFLSPAVTAYSDILGDKNVTLTTSAGLSPVFYVEGGRTIRAGGAAGAPGFSLTINSTIEGTTAPAANQPQNIARIVNPGGPVTLGSGAGGNLPYTVLNGVDIQASAVNLKGAFYYASEYLRFHAPVTIDSTTTTVFSIDNELLLEKGINSGATARGVAFEINGGATATINPLPDGATPIFSGVEFRPTPGSEGAQVELKSSLKTTSSTGAIRINLPVYLGADTTLTTTGSGTVQVGATGSIQSLDPLKPAKLSIATTQLQLNGAIGDKNPVAGLTVTGSLKTLAATSVTAVGDILQTGNTTPYQITGLLKATSQSGNISLPNFFKSADTAGTGAIDFSAPNGKIALYAGTTDPTLATMTLASIKLSALNGIDLAPHLIATGAPGISIIGPQKLWRDTTYTVNQSSAPIVLGGQDSDSAGGRSLNLVSGGGAVSFVAAVGSVNGLKDLTVSRAGSLTIQAPIQAVGQASLQADAMAIGSPLTTTTLTFVPTSPGRPICLGDNPQDSLALDGSETRRLLAGTIQIGSSETATASGLVTVAGDAPFSAVTQLVRLNAPEGIQTANWGGVTVPTLALSTAKSISLTGNNSVHQLTGQLPSDLSFHTAGDLELGTITSGFSVGGSADISATGAISQAQAMSVAGTLRLSAKAVSGQGQPIRLDRADNSIQTIRLGNAGDVNLAVAGDLSLSQETVSVGGTRVPSDLASLTATTGAKGRLTLASDLTASGAVQLTSGVPTSLTGNVNLSGKGITLQGGVRDLNGHGLALNAGNGTLSVDTVHLSGDLSLVDLGGSSQVDSVRAGSVTVTKGTGTVDLGSPVTSLLTVNGGSLNLVLDSVAQVGTLAARNTGVTVVGSSKSTNIILPPHSTIHKLGLDSAVQSVTFSGTSILTDGFLVPGEVIFTVGSTAKDSLTVPGGITVAQGGTLKGNGTLAGTLTIQGGGVLQPGALTIQGDLNLNSQAVLQTDISGDTAAGGSGHLVVEGAADVTNAKLQLTHLTDYLFSKNQTFSVLESGSGGKVTGTFASLADQARFSAIGSLFSVDYQSGPSGRDIRVTAITDTGDQPAAPVFTSTPAASFLLNQTSSFTLAASGSPPPDFTILRGTLPNGLTLNRFTGEISGTPVEAMAGVYPITFQADNGVGTPATQAFTLTLRETPAFTSATSAYFRVGADNSFQFTATGYPAPSFTLNDTLPSGLALDTLTGKLTGSPAGGTGGVYSLTVVAGNGTGSDASQAFTLTVQQVPIFTSTDRVSFRAGEAGSFRLTATGYPQPVFRLEGTLPEGVSLDAETGMLAGTPAVDTGGAYPITLIATNGVGNDARQDFSLMVHQAPVFTSDDNGQFVSGEAGQFTFSARSYPASSYSITEGVLPDGLSLDPSTGILSGIPTGTPGGLIPLVIVASNGNGPDAVQKFTLTLNEPAKFQSADHATLTVGKAGSFQMVASGFPLPTFALAEGSAALPAGLTLSAEGLISGTPASGNEGAHTLTLLAQNGVGPGATQTFTLTVSPAENSGGGQTGGNLGGSTQVKPGVYAVAAMGGPAGMSMLNIYENGTDRFIRAVEAFPGFRGEFYVDSGDISGDGIDDIIVGSGNGSLNGHVVVFDGARLLVETPLVPVELGYQAGGSVRASLYAFINYSSGVAVRLAEVTGDGIADIVLAPGTGAGTVTQSHLRVWDGKLAMEQFERGDAFLDYNYGRWELASFYAFGGDAAPGGGVAISVLRQTGGDRIIASQLFGNGVRVFH